jgi:hypothetical protein
MARLTRRTPASCAVWPIWWTKRRFCPAHSRGKLVSAAQRPLAMPVHCEFVAVPAGNVRSVGARGLDLAVECRRWV